MIQPLVENIVFGQAVSLPPQVDPSQSLDIPDMTLHDNQGGELRLSKHNSTFKVIAQTPEATTWFAAIDNPVQFHQIMQSIAEEVLQADVSTLSEHFANPDKVPAYQQRFTDQQAQFGDLQSVTYLGAENFSHYLIGHLRFCYENANRVLSFAWQEGKIIGRIPDDADKETIISLTAYPQNANTVAGHNLQSGESFTLTFSDNGVTLKTAHQTVNLHRKQME